MKTTDDEHLVKLKVKGAEGGLEFSVDEVLDKDLSMSGVNIIIKDEDSKSELILKVVSYLLTTDISELSKEHKDILSKCSFSGRRDGYYIDDNTGIILGYQGQLEAICQKIDSVNEQSAAKKEHQESVGVLNMFAESFAKQIINSANNGN